MSCSQMNQQELVEMEEKVNNAESKAEYTIKQLENLARKLKIQLNQNLMKYYGRRKLKKT